MVKFILISFFMVIYARADIFDFGSDKGSSKIPVLVEKLRGLEMKDGPEFEDVFNQGVKNIENAIEEEKLYCTGESANSEGKTLPAAQKPLCMRELKKHYMEATNAVFEMKKKYLGFIHQRQLQKLNDIQAKLKADIERNF
jgi:hypothetical protein